MDRWILRIHVWLLATVLPVLVRRVRLQRLVVWLTPRGPSERYRRIGQQAILAVIQRRLRRPWRMKARRCLRMGLMAFHFLRLANVPAGLHFAVRPPRNGRFRGHCWVTVADQCVTPPAVDAVVEVFSHGPLAGSAS